MEGKLFKKGRGERKEDSEEKRKKGRNEVSKGRKKKKVGELKKGKTINEGKKVGKTK